MAASIAETDAFVSSILSQGQTTAPPTLVLPTFDSPKQETLIEGLLPIMIGLAVIFILLLVFLSIDNVSNHYAAESIGNRAKFAIFLSLFMISAYNLTNLIYRLIKKKGLPNTNLIWIVSLLFFSSILSVTFFRLFST